MEAPLKRAHCIRLTDDAREEMISVLSPLESMSGFVEIAVRAEARRRKRSAPRPVRLSPARRHRQAA